MFSGVPQWSLAAQASSGAPRCTPQCIIQVEKSIHQAIVQKLARLVSTLYATRLLLNHGFVQEVGALKRVLDEIQDDILFLWSGIDDQSPLHREFLDAFFEEEFDADTALESTQKRKMIPRSKIRAHNARVIANIRGAPFDPSRTTEVLRTINKAYSGYVHAASPQIMEVGYPFDSGSPKM